MSSSILALRISDNTTGKNKTKRAIAEFKLSDGKTKTVYFGMANSAGTFFDGAPETKKQNYIKRHSKLVFGEDWKLSGIMTPGWLSRFVLWEKQGNRMTQEFLKAKTKIGLVSVNLSSLPIK